MTLRRARALRFVLVVLAALGLWSGCASAVRPPAEVADPVTVRLVASGRHAGLLLPCPDGRIVEYGYGAWGWYALGEDDWWRAPGTVLLPNRGTLGRRYFTEEDVAEYAARIGGRLEPLVVDRADAEALLARLDAEFAAGGDPHFQPRYGLRFVPVARSYWMFHDCHDEMAAWLGEIGCSVGWAPVRTGLEVER